MTEREMEDLVWEHPEKFLNEPLTQFQRQPASSVGRADLIFLDRIGRVLVIELKRGVLERGAVPQIVDYFGMLKSRFPDKSVELMIIANSIPPERRVSCEQFHIEAVEITHKKFRDVVEEIGYVFRSETANATPPSLGLDRLEPELSATRARPIEMISPTHLRRPRKDGTTGRAKTAAAIFLPSSMPKEAAAFGVLRQTAGPSWGASISR